VLKFLNRVSTFLVILGGVSQIWFHSSLIDLSAKYDAGQINISQVRSQDEFHKTLFLFSIITLCTGLITGDLTYKFLGNSLPSQN